MKILITGSGGREHAIAHCLYQQGHCIYCVPGNLGTEEFSEPLSETLDPYNFPHLIDFVKKNRIDLVIAGPEAFLVQGMGNAFTKAGIPFFGPSSQGALLESSKAWAKQFMRKYGIPTARFVVFKTKKEALESFKVYFDQWKALVVKSSGLAGGKGVSCCLTEQEARQAIEGKDADEEIVFEKLLQGREVSLLAFCDGKTIVPMLPCQDHKRIYDGDKGANTGGMGAYAPVTFITQHEMQLIQELIVERTQEGLNKEGIDYRGVLYFGLMLTSEGPMLLEYNCRFGDPEAQVILPLLDSDLGELMRACTEGTLSSQKIAWKPKASCCVVMSSGGYPGDYQTGEAILGLDQAKNLSDTLVFHAGTGKNAKGEVMTTGGRVLGVTGLGDTLNEAIQRAYRGVKSIKFLNAHYRHDIAYQSKIN